MQEQTTSIQQMIQMKLDEAGHSGITNMIEHSHIETAKRCLRLRGDFRVHVDFHPGNAVEVYNSSGMGAYEYVGGSSPTLQILPPLGTFVRIMQGVVLVLGSLFCSLVGGFFGFVIAGGATLLYRVFWPMPPERGINMSWNIACIGGCATALVSFVWCLRAFFKKDGK